MARIRLVEDAWRIDEPGIGRSIYWCGQEKCLKAITAKGKAAWGMKRPIRQELLAELRLRLGSLKRYN